MCRGQQAGHTYQRQGSAEARQKALTPGQTFGPALPYTADAEDGLVPTSVSTKFSSAHSFFWMSGESSFVCSDLSEGYKMVEDNYEPITHVLYAEGGVHVHVDCRLESAAMFSLCSSELLKTIYSRISLC